MVSLVLFVLDCVIVLSFILVLIVYVICVMGGWYGILLVLFDMFVCAVCFALFVCLDGVTVRLLLFSIVGVWVVLVVFYLCFGDSVGSFYNSDLCVCVFGWLWYYLVVLCLGCAFAT